MGTIQEYLMGVVVAAILCGLLSSLTGQKGTIGTAIKLMSGILMLLAVMRPWADISLDHFFDWKDSFGAEASNYASMGQQLAQETYRQSIISQAQAYILDEAKGLDCDIQVEVFLTEENPPVPKRVRLTGTISPYARRSLMNFISERLGIGQEDQIWT